MCTCTSQLCPERAGPSWAVEGGEGGRTAYGAGAGRGGKVRGGRRQAGWPTAKALNLTDGEG